jgi:trehalose 6-phosphate phosphatase
MNRCSEQVLDRLCQSESLCLFLDYDGTLADFASTPDVIQPDAELTKLLDDLAHRPNTRLAIISGRRLAHVEALLPLTGVWLAGTYGIELRSPTGEHIERLDFATVRPVIDQAKPKLEVLLTGRPGFYLEDKGWALAIHARYVKESEAQKLLTLAKTELEPYCQSGEFQLLGGDKFLEIGPRLADKGLALEYLLGQVWLPGATVAYFGDDDKDERAFEIVKAHRGTAILVALKPRSTHANCRLDSPQAVRQWLKHIATKTSL